jgi:hypothetical protein
MIPGSGKSSYSDAGIRDLFRVIGGIAMFFYLYSGFRENDWSEWGILVLALIFLGLGQMKPKV